MTQAKEFKESRPQLLVSSELQGSTDRFVLFEGTSASICLVCFFVYFPWLILSRESITIGSPNMEVRKPCLGKGKATCFVVPCKTNPRGSVRLRGSPNSRFGFGSVSLERVSEGVLVVSI